MRMPFLVTFMVLVVTGAAGAEQVLQSDRLRVAISETTGAVVSVADRKDGLEILGASPDRYVLQPTPDTETAAGEGEDRVVSRAGQALVCANPKLPGIRIEKEYRVQGRFLTKRVRFSAAGKDVGLLKYSVSSVVPGRFYAGGYLNDPSRHPHDYPYLFTKDLQTERQVKDSHGVADHHLVIFTNPEAGRGLAQYRLKVDGRFVHPLSSYGYEPGLFYGPDGWRMAVAAKWMSSDREPLECETRWHLFEGDHVALHQEYMALPEFAAQWAHPSPAWVKDVAGIATWTLTANGPRMDRYREIAESLGSGTLMVTLGGIFHNTRDYLSDPIATAEGIPLPAAELRRIVDALHAASPRIKVGPITWQWGFGDLDPVTRSHPEWTVRDGKGQPVFAASGWQDERVFSTLLTPPCRQFVVNQYREACRRFDFDFIYMDTGQGGVTRFDWNTKWGAQDYDWADLYKGIQDATRANRNGATFFNGTPRLYSSFCDCGYFEGVGFVNVRDWRALADRLFLVKLYQPGDRWTMPLYWTDDVLEPYAAWCLALALKPVSFLGGPKSTPRWPLMAAANELREARLSPQANPRPCWWKEKTETEAYALRLPGGGLLTAINHDSAAATTELSADLAPLGLDARKPVHVWLFRPRLAKEFEEKVRLTEAGADATYRSSGRAAYRAADVEFLGTKTFAGGRAQVPVSLESGRVALVLLTQSPVLATAVAGRPRHLLLPPGRGEKAETVSADRPLPADLVARRDAYDVTPEKVSWLLQPPRSAPERMNRQVTETGKEVAGLRVIRLLAYDCEHNVEDTATARIEGDSIRLAADMGLEKTSGFAHAGVEAENAGNLRLCVTLGAPRFGRFRAQDGGCFVGLVADYYVGQGYTRRVRFALAPVGANALANPRPWWGLFDADATGGKPFWVDLSQEFRAGEAREFTLDLGRYAPEGWTGRILFGPYLESCGLDAKLTVGVLGNGPAGGPDPTACAAPPAPPAKGKVAAVFQGANVYRFEDGAEVRDGRILFPANGLIEADGIRVTRWLVRRAADSTAAELMVNFQRADGKYELHHRDLGALVPAGREGEVGLDLGEFAPADWNGRVRIRLRGTGVTAELVASSAFQIF